METLFLIAFSVVLTILSAITTISGIRILMRKRKEDEERWVKLTVAILQIGLGSFACWMFLSSTLRNYEKFYNTF